MMSRSDAAIFPVRSVVLLNCTPRTITRIGDLERSLRQKSQASSRTSSDGMILVATASGLPPSPAASKAPSRSTLLTLPMFPVLVVMYGRLARREEQELQVELRDQYAAYMAVTPAFFPRLRPAPGKHCATQ